jgi:hypothetical protein
MTETVNMEKVIPVLYMGSEQYLSIGQANVRTLKRDI